MVGLAKELEGKPFHLIATHCQNATRADVVRFIRSKGLELAPENLTVSSFGGHPKVKGNGYVPYYMIFDQHGRLVHHHMSGAFHGGDGLAMLERVHKLVKEANRIYLGKAPFDVVRKLAAQVRDKRKLPATVRAIEAELEAAPDPKRVPELKRLYAVVKAYREEQLARVAKLKGSNPPEAVPVLKALTTELRGTKLGQDLATKLTELQRDPEYKRALSIWKGFTKLVKATDKLRKPTPAKLLKQAKKFRKLIDGSEKLPIATTVQDYISLLE